MPWKCLNFMVVVGGETNFWVVSNELENFQTMSVYHSPKKMLNILPIVLFNLLNQTYLCSYHLWGTELPEVQDFRLCHIVLSCGEQRGTYT